METSEMVAPLVIGPSMLTTARFQSLELEASVSSAQTRSTGASMWRETR
jgi:hypothetical protein